ncbi:MAG: class I SAM-dependent methyltransferase [Candidatus Margulisbacteria bacterium]|nr:class I SAM-dependent methyltransferase [Candidatus Margulisiibacteriota bacterium]
MITITSALDKPRFKNVKQAIRSAEIEVFNNLPSKIKAKHVNYFFLAEAHNKAYYKQTKPRDLIVHLKMLQLSAQYRFFADLGMGFGGLCFAAEEATDIKEIVGFDLAKAIYGHAMRIKTHFGYKRCSFHLADFTQVNLTPSRTGVSGVYHLFQPFFTDSVALLQPAVGKLPSDSVVVATILREEAPLIFPEKHFERIYPRTEKKSDQIGQFVYLHTYLRR